MSDQAVLVYLPVPSEGGFDLDQLETRLTETIDGSGVGEFDGHEIGRKDVVLFTYGPDAHELFAVIEPVLRSGRLPAGSYAIIRIGEPGAATKHVPLD